MAGVDIHSVLVVFGTRPEALKLAPVIGRLTRESHRFTTTVCVTAQHRQMLDQAMHFLGIRPDIDLNLMQPEQGLANSAARILEGTSQVISSMQPDLVVVHGDTTTAMTTAMAAFFSGSPVAHIEAGLRTHDLTAPFPEELNRQLVTKMSRWHFAPTEHNRANLMAEGVPDSNIFVTGNTIVDTLHATVHALESDALVRSQVSRELDEYVTFDWRLKDFVLITGHRRENFGSALESICMAIRELASHRPDTHFVYPVHLNPQVLGPVTSLLGGLGNVHLLPPLRYQSFVALLMACRLVLTDSGGIQEEAPSLGRPVLVMRECSERPEGLDAGVAMLVGSSQEAIVASVTEVLDEAPPAAGLSIGANPYGDGLAAQRIVGFLGDILM